MEEFRMVISFLCNGYYVDFLAHMAIPQIQPTMRMYHPLTGEECLLEYKGTMKKRQDVHKFTQRPKLPKTINPWTNPL